MDKTNLFKVRKGVPCDYCGKTGATAPTTYGTTNYTRFICKECMERINHTNQAIGDEARVTIGGRANG